MDFSYTEEQQEVSALARRLLADRVSHEGMTELERSGRPRYDADLWLELAQADLLGIGLPERVGGSGLGLLAQALVLEEIGRTVAPVPYLASIAMAADLLATFGTPDQIDRWVRPAIGGNLILTAAISDPTNPDPRRPTTTATPTDDGWQLDGIKTMVPAAQIADAIVVTAWLDGRAVAFVVDPSAAGVIVSPQETTSGEPYGYVELDDTTVTAAELVGGDANSRDSVVEHLIQRASIGQCAVQLGVTEEALRATAEYTKQRVQFDRPIATFQAVGHRCADAYIDVEAIRLTLWQAIYTLESGGDARVDVQTAKFWAADGGHRVAHAIVHLHGGMGIATEHFIHRYFAFAKQLELTLGGATKQALGVGAMLAAEVAP